jgi:hypothetical protein
MSEDAQNTVMIYIPGGANTPEQIVAILNQVIGQNVRLGAHDLWHETERDEDMHPDARTIRHAQIEGLLDYADRIDQWNSDSSQWMRQHFGWAFPPTNEESTNGTD